MSVDDYSQKSYIRLLRLGSHNRNSREEMDSSTRLLVRRSLLCVLSPVCFSLHADSALQWAFLRAASTHSLRLRSSCVSRSCSSSSTSTQIQRRTATPQKSSPPAFTHGISAVRQGWRDYFSTRFQHTLEEGRHAHRPLDLLRLLHRWRKCVYVSFFVVRSDADRRRSLQWSRCSSPR